MRLLKNVPWKPEIGQKSSARAEKGRENSDGSNFCPDYGQTPHCIKVKKEVKLSRKITTTRETFILKIMSLNNQIVSEAKKKLQKQEKICFELPEEQRKGAMESEKTTSPAKELKNIEKSSKIESKTSHSISPVKRAPRLGDMMKTPSIEKNGRWVRLSKFSIEKTPNQNFWTSNK